MTLPQPPVALDNVCSVIYSNTLYTYSTNAFQALPLSSGGNWTQLPQGEKVTGGVCVGSTPANADAAGFYVVGGKGESADYKGLQKFTYATGQWESITPTSVVTQDRLWHGATYLNASDTILMYAGAQDGSQFPSTQTFTIGTLAPYQVTAYQSIAPPTINPILMPWSNDQAVLIGGSTTNTQVMLFSPASSWVDSGASLAVPLDKDVSSVKAALVNGDDGSKNLYTFDMTVSPNTVQRVVLIDGSGAPVQKSAAIKKRATDEKRADATALTLGSWPEYNSTLAPTATRTNYAVAEDPNGVVVISGGNADDVLCIFDGRQNGWENATARFADQKVFAADVSSSSTSSLQTATSTTATATSLSTSAPVSTSASATPTAAAVGTPSGSSSSTDGVSTEAILGSVLGSIAGVALILALLYICVVRQRKRQAHAEAGHARRASGASSNEKDGIGFANDSFPRSPGLSTFRGHQQQDSHGSFSSMAILMGRANGNKGQGSVDISRNPSNNSRRDSGDSTFRAFKSTISKPMPQPTHEIGPPPPRPETRPEMLQPDMLREDRGVSFAADTAEPRPRPSVAAAAIDRQGSTRRSSGWNRYWSGGSALNILGYGNKNNQDSRRTTKDSDGSNYSDPHRITQDSATVPPLNVYEPRASFSRVNSGSPTITQFKAGKHEGMSGQIERPVSTGSDNSGYSSGIPASVHEAWDPTSANKPWGTDRAGTASSFYSNYTTPLAPSRPPPPPQSQRPSRPPTGVSQQPQLAMASTSSDMSWLNLGEGPRL